MKLTAMDITNKEFSKGFRGYNCDDVDDFLDKVAEDYEFIYKENSSLKEKVNSLEEKIKQFEKVQDTIQSTLILAQNAADQAKTTAGRESEIILNKANEASTNIINIANREVFKINNDFDKQKQEFVKFRAKFRSFMNAQLEMFENLENDFLTNYKTNIGEEEVQSKDIVIEKITDTENIKDIEAKDDIKFDVKSEVKATDFQSDLNEIKSFFASED